MIDITDFDNSTHRVESASAAFQKGLYHLFILKNRQATDIYDQVLRMYQCLFQLNLTELLLDFDFQLSKLRIQRRLRQRCQNYEQPTRKELDPGALVTHATLKNWKGFWQGHPLERVNKQTRDLHERVVESRHNLLYRPFMLDQCFWEDCTLIDLLKHLPSTKEIEEVYKDFFRAMVDWHLVVEEQMKMPQQGKTPRVIFKNMVVENYLDGSPPLNSRPASYFIELLFMVYKDRVGARPTETLLLTYARMLNPNDEQLLQEVRDYRNWLLDIGNLVRACQLAFLDEWRVGEL